MQLTNILISLAVVISVSAEGHHNGTASVKRQCRSIAHMTKYIDLAANDTLLAEKTDGNQTKIDAIKAKAANITVELDKLTANATLMGECTVVTAHDDAIRACVQIKELEKVTATAGNDTKLQDKFDGNATKIAAFKAHASALATKLSDLQSNTTQAVFCAAHEDTRTCKGISGLQKTIALAGNDTALRAKLADFESHHKEKGNETDSDIEDKIAKFKAGAAKAQTKLDELMSNATLMGTCQSLAKAEGATQGSSAASTNTTASPDENSAAATLQRLRHSATVAFVVLMGSAVYML